MLILSNDLRIEKFSGLFRSVRSIDFVPELLPLEAAAAE